MKKTLKSIKAKFGMLNESYAWERQEGKPLPTLADVQAKHNAKPVNVHETISPIKKVESFVNHVNDLYKQINESADLDINTFSKSVREKLIEIES
tara:strand:- start:151 stop:435 length:285 start_codon:yes stop_codon:yes gene_type:complete